MKQLTKLAQKKSAIIAIALLGGVLTYVLIMLLSRGQSVWFDEGYSILLAKSSFHDLFSLTAVDAHPPTYYVLLKLWAGVFGWSELALRSMSAVFAGLSVAGSFILIRKLFSTNAATLVMPLLIIAPFVLRYGYEIRMYAMAGLIGVVSTIILVYARQRNSKKWWIWYALSVALGMYTLYMTAALWLAHLVWLIVTTPKDQRLIKRFVKQPWVFAYIGAVVLFLPYIATFYHQLTHSVLPGIGHQITLTEAVNIAGFIFVYTPEWQLNGSVSLAIAVALILATYVVVKLIPRLRAGDNESMKLLLIMAIVPQLFFVLISIVPGHEIFVVRYIAHTVLFIYILLASIAVLGYVYKLKKPAVVLGLLLLGLYVGGVMQLNKVGNFNIERQQKPESAQLRSDITCSSQSVIIADDPYAYIDNYYYFDGCDLRFFSENKVAYGGGYAPLSGSLLRIDDTTQLHKSTIYHIRWDGQTQHFTAPNSYRLVATHQYDKQIVDVYKLSAE